MINRFIIWLFLVFGVTETSAIEVSINYAVFQSNETAYLELYTRFFGETVQFVSIDSTDQVQSSVEYLLLIRKEDSLHIAEKYIVNSPMTNTSSDFWDSKRYSLQDGYYDISLQLVDLNNTSDTLSIDWDISVVSVNGKIHSSDMLLLSEVHPDNGTQKFCKNGFCFEPLSFGLIGPDNQTLISYQELYQLTTEIDSQYYVQYYAQSLDSTGQIIKTFPSAYKKLIAREFEPLLLEYDANTLPSGNYRFVTEIRIKDKTLIKSSSKSFSVYHPQVDYQLKYQGDTKFETAFVQFLDGDELDYALKAIYPRVGNTMTEALNVIIKSEDLLTKRYFLYHFWSGFSATNPKEVYEKYMKVAKAIDQRYANNVGYGFESDRGYYFLKYGRPDDIVFVEDEPSAPPYEIWIYNYMPETQETNVRFLFYNPSLASNDFILLHSTCRGERNNPRWEVDLYSDDYNATSEHYIDARRVNEGFNRNARRFFSDAR